MLVIESNDLVWKSLTRSFVVEASKLEARYRIHRLDYENGQWFLHIRSHRTGNLEKFVRSREEKCMVGELLAVHFRNERHNVNLTILND